MTVIYKTYPTAIITNWMTDTICVCASTHKWHASPFLDNIRFVWFVNIPIVFFSWLDWRVMHTLGDHYSVNITRYCSFLNSCNFLFLWKKGGVFTLICIFLMPLWKFNICKPCGFQVALEYIQSTPILVLINADVWYVWCMMGLFTQ